MWIDTHCHVWMDNTVDNAIDRAFANDVDKLIVVGCDAVSSQQSFDVANANSDRIRAVIGLHPHEAMNEIASTETVLLKALEINSDIVVGIGECGLDYFYEHSTREKQQEIFAQQIELANKYSLTLVIHTRDAWDDTLAILHEVGIPTRTVIHCFTGGIDEAKKFLDLGIYLSFSGITTFKNAANVQEAAAFCPTNRMTIETDSPFLAPIPFRGKPNEPANVGVVGSFISELKKQKKEQFAAEIYNSTVALFNL